MPRWNFTSALVGPPLGSVPIDVLSPVLSRKTIRGSIVGTRQDLAEALRFDADGKVTATHTIAPLEADQRDPSRGSAREESTAGSS